VGSRASSSGQWATARVELVNPGVVIPRTTMTGHVEDSLGAAHGRLPDAAIRRRIVRLVDALEAGSGFTCLLVRRWRVEYGAAHGRAPMLVPPAAKGARR